MNLTQIFEDFDRKYQYYDNTTNDKRIKGVFHLLAPYGDNENTCYQIIYNYYKDILTKICDIANKNKDKTVVLHLIDTPGENYHGTVLTCKLALFALFNAVKSKKDDAEFLKYKNLQINIGFRNKDKIPDEIDRLLKDYKDDGEYKPETLVSTP